LVGRAERRDDAPIWEGTMGATAAAMEAGIVERRCSAIAGCVVTDRTEGTLSA
jgi:hypothetical protein